MDQRKVKGYVNNHGCEWIFNPPPPAYICNTNRCRWTSTAVTLYAFDYEDTPTWPATWQLCSTWRLRTTPLETCPVPRGPILDTMEARVPSKHADQDQVGGAKEKSTHRRHSTCKRGGSLQKWLAHRKSFRSHWEWWRTSKEGPSWDSERRCKEDVSATN